MATTKTPTATVNSFPSFDLTNIKFPTNFEELKAAVPVVDTDRILGIVRDAAYVVIGFGVLTVQQIQSRARDLVSTLEGNPVVKQMGVTRTQLEEYVARFEAEVAKYDDRFEALEAKLDDAFEKLEDRLPQQAADVLGQAHDMAKAARKQVRGLLRNAA